MLALGVDPGTRNLGWGLVQREGRQLVHVAHGVIRMDGSDAMPLRLLQIYERLGAVLSEYRPQLASVEQIFFHKDAQAAAKLGQARGVVLLVLQMHGVTVREHAPGRIKRTLTGDGHADKARVAEVVKRVLGLSETPAVDASDALAMAMTELRLEAQTTGLELQRKSQTRKQLPPHFAAALARARARSS